MLADFIITLFLLFRISTTFISVSNITASTKPKALEKFAASTIRTVWDWKSDGNFTGVNCHDQFAKKQLFAC